MNKTTNTNLATFLKALVVVQLLYCLYVTGNQVLFNSSLKLWLSGDYFRYQKVQMMLGGDYQIAQQLSSIPEDAGILLVRQDSPWFISYYMLPKRMYVYPAIGGGQVTTEAGLKAVSGKWIKEKNIDFVLVYGPKEIKILKTGKDIIFK